MDKVFKKKSPGFELGIANKTAKDQGRNIFFSTHVNMKVPIQKENRNVKHDYLQQLMEQDKRKAEKMNGYIRNMKVRLQGRELVTQSNFFKKKAPDLNGVLTLTKFGFSGIKNNKIGSPEVKRIMHPINPISNNTSNSNKNNLQKRNIPNIPHFIPSDTKMSPNYQRFNSSKYYYVGRNNG